MDATEASQFTRAGRLGSASVKVTDASLENPLMLPGHWLRAINQYKWWILAAGLAFGIVGLAVANLIRPTYRATASLLVEPGTPKTTTPEDLYFPAMFGREHFQSQLEIIRSREIAVRVIERLGLAADFKREETRTLWNEAFDRLSSMLFVESNAPAGEPDPVRARSEDLIVRQFSSRLSVEPIKLSNIITISFRSADPAVSAKVANEVANSYIATDIDNRIELARNSGRWIAERLESLRQELDVSERALQDFRDRRGMLDSKNTVLGGVGRELDEITHRLVEARVRRSEAEEALNQLRAGKDGSVDSSPGIVKNATVQRAKNAESDAEIKLAELSQLYGTSHPLYLSAKSEYDSARANSSKQIQTIVASINKEFQAARAMEKSLEMELAESKSIIQGLNRKELEIGPLEREVLTNRQLYQTFLTRQRETSTIGDAVAPGARLIDAAVVPTRPVSPQKKLIVFSFSAFGLSIGLLGALYRYSSRRTVRREEDVELMLNVPLLASLPIIPDRKNAFGYLMKQRRHPYNEAVRVAMTSILLSLPAKGETGQVIAVTSAMAEEGKTTFSLALSHAVARNRKVVVVECDLRRPSFEAYMSAYEPHRRGLVDILEGNAKIQDAVIPLPEIGIHAIQRGVETAEPLDLLYAAAFDAVVADLRGLYDVVVLDCPPVHSVADSIVIGRVTDGMIFIVKSDSTPAATASFAIQKLQRSGLNLLGAILSQHNHKKASNYYGEYVGAEKGYYYAR